MSIYTPHHLPHRIIPVVPPFIVPSWKLGVRHSAVSTNLHGANLFWSALLFPQKYIVLASSGQRH
jgi:hypothetical protein